MTEAAAKELTYFPGCSMATTAIESHEALMLACRRMGVSLNELEDWNCCGSSSAHSLDAEMAQALPSRNFSIAPAGRPLVMMCPSCMNRMLLGHKHLRDDPELRAAYEKRWGRPIDPDLEIIHFFDVMDAIDFSALPEAKEKRLKGIRVAPYYGCMLTRPPALMDTPDHFGSMERALRALGAEPVRWGGFAKCCGTFHSAARPDISSPMVEEIMEKAARADADCIVTACAMCQMNLEMRCGDAPKTPILHLSEILALGLGEEENNKWFGRHLIDPRPMLRSKGVIP